ncbi:hypothetical protein LU604_06785 [Erwinia tracheiphila]|uniref:Uncharacterized protein n=1 Tax=Erwinia tracheiphila TaxID=65700 RepID=A0A345CTA8_9GAMM|nr:hypothetical protein [Erwinia tracheiphila]AXF76675.1 hypothetical protein AV903_12515 [Erwinia tracheiphila]UIA84648.1 hypothetical protein LU604_06785 [Erwinia tracheiphila]UIA93241.1 hypothetical protein LU632_06770 [Erwinia tracheiphila]
MLKTFTLRLTQSVNHYLLADIRALLPAESVQFFTNELDEEWQITLLCVQSDKNCSLAVSVILMWHQLRRIRTIVYSTITEHHDVSDYNAAQLLNILNKPEAVLYLS